MTLTLKNGEELHLDLPVRCLCNCYVYPTKNIDPVLSLESKGLRDSTEVKTSALCVVDFNLNIISHRLPRVIPNYCQVAQSIPSKIEKYSTQKNTTSNSRKKNNKRKYQEQLTYSEQSHYVQHCFGCFQAHRINAVRWAGLDC